MGILGDKIKAFLQKREGIKGANSQLNQSNFSSGVSEAINRMKNNNPAFAQTSASASPSISSNDIPSQLQGIESRLSMLEGGSDNLNAQPALAPDVSLGNVANNIIQQQAPQGDIAGQQFVASPFTMRQRANMGPLKTCKK